MELSWSTSVFRSDFECKQLKRHVQLWPLWAEFELMVKICDIFALFVCSGALFVEWPTPALQMSVNL